MASSIYINIITNGEVLQQDKIHSLEIDMNENEQH